jgi:hypothetical protein
MRHVSCVTSLTLLCVAAAFVATTALAATAASKDDDNDAFATTESTEPLAELLLGRWRLDVVVQDLSPPLRESFESGEEEAAAASAAAREPVLGEIIAQAWASLVGTSRTVLRSAVRRFWPDEPGFHLELGRGLHDGVLVGKVSMQDAGHFLLRDLLLGRVGGAADTRPPLPPLLALDEALRSGPEAPFPFIASAPVTVECATLSSCRMHLGEEGDAAAAWGEVHLTLPFRSAKSANKVRSGRWEWKPAAGAAVRFVTRSGAPGAAPTEVEVAAAPLVVLSLSIPELRGGLLVATNKHGLASVASEVLPFVDTKAATASPAALMRQHRLVLRRETPDLNRAEPDMPATISWLSGSWWHVALYALLLGIVLFGKFGTRWFMLRFRGIDIDPWIKTMRGGRRETKPKRRLMTDAEIHKMMAADDAADRSRVKRTGKKD